MRSRGKPNNLLLPSEGQVRIIGGEWRSRKLHFPNVEGLRPTGDRMRETLFNWIQPWVPGARVLDLFAGAGSLGFEAASRGASRVVMVEKHPLASKAILANIHRLQASQVDLVQGDAFAFLAGKGEVSTFDLVFIDPPFREGVQEIALTALAENRWLAPQAFVYVEFPAREDLSGVPADWQLHREKKAGDVQCRLYRLSSGLSG